MVAFDGAAYDAIRSEVVDHVVDAGGERLDVGRVDRGVHRDPQLVAAELAVGLGVDDPVGAQGLRRSRRRRSTRRSRWCRSPASGGPGPRRTAWCTTSSRPSRRARRSWRWSARPCRRARPGRSSSPAARPSGTAWRPTGCCRSGSCASCRSRSAGRRTPGCAGRSRRSRRRGRAPRGDISAIQRPPSEAKHFCGAK